MLIPLRLSAPAQRLSNGLGLENLANSVGIKSGQRLQLDEKVKRRLVVWHDKTEAASLLTSQ